MRCFRSLSFMVLSGGITFISCVLIPLCTWAESDLATLDKISRNSESTTQNKKALIFVHGTIGDPQKTWTGKGEVYWPKLVTQDNALNDFDVFVFGFYSPVLGEGPSVVGIANQLNSLLTVKSIVSSSPNGRYQKIHFVAHSLGNLVVRQAMQNKDIYRNVEVPLLVSLAAPNQGADLATVAKHISENPTLQSMSEFQWNDFLKGLNQNWLTDHPLTEVVCAFETLEYPTEEDPGPWGTIVDFFTPQIDFIVSESSASSICSTTRGTPRPFTTDHVWIAKPGELRLKDPRHEWLRQQLTAVSKVKKSFNIKLMDSLLVTYDEELKKKGKLNSHQIQDILRENDLDGETIQIDTEWNSTKTKFIIRQNPDLIVIHFSAFRGLPKQTEDYQGKLAEFINRILNTTKSRVLIYSRWREDDYGKMSKYFFDNLWTFPNPASAAKRIFFLDVSRITQGGVRFDVPNPTFGVQSVRDALLKKVKEVLELS